MTWNAADYVDVAERIRTFYDKYPEGSLQSGTPPHVIQINGQAFIAYHARAFRSAEDPCPADGWAWEPVPGPTNFTKDSELQNAETSAWGRAIVALGFETKKIASAEEVRARDSGAGNRGGSSAAAPAPDKPFSEARPDMTNEQYLALVAAAQEPGALASMQVWHFGKNKGMLLSQASPAQIRWLAQDWKIQEDSSPYDHRLRQAAIALNAGQDSPNFIVPFE